jgi:hypothetical protein
VQELPASFGVPPPELPQSIDTTTGEPPTQVMVSVRAVMSTTTVATVVPAAFFTVTGTARLSLETGPLTVVKQTAEPFFTVSVAVVASGLLVSISISIFTPLSKHMLLITAVGVVVDGVGQTEAPHIVVVCRTQAPSGMQAKTRSR